MNSNNRVFYKFTLWYFYAWFDRFFPMLSEPRRLFQSREVSRLDRNRAVILNCTICHRMQSYIFLQLREIVTSPKADFLTILTGYCVIYLRTQCIGTHLYHADMMNVARNPPVECKWTNLLLDTLRPCVGVKAVWVRSATSWCEIILPQR